MADVNERASRRGRKAETELEETGAAFAAVEAVMLDKLRQAPIGADKLILNLHASLQVLDGVRTMLMKTVSAGKTADVYAAAAEAVGGGLDETETP